MSPSLGWSKPFSMPKAAGMQLYFRFKTSPGALALGGRADFLTTTTTRRGERVLYIDEFSDLSIGRTFSASARAR